MIEKPKRAGCCGPQHRKGVSQLSAAKILEAEAPLANMMLVTCSQEPGGSLLSAFACIVDQRSSDDFASSKELRGKNRSTREDIKGHPTQLEGSIVSFKLV